MKHQGKLVSAIILVVMLFGAASTVAKARDVVDDSKKPSYLLSMSATSGSLNQGELKLDGVPLVVYFTDRPYRKAGHWSLEDFAKVWKLHSETNRDDPPNAELAIYAQTGDTQAVLILSKPKTPRV